MAPKKKHLDCELRLIILPTHPIFIPSFSFSSLLFYCPISLVYLLSLYIGASQALILVNFGLDIFRFNKGMLSAQTPLLVTGGVLCTSSLLL